jgi:thioredoxin reductase (NADPH)
VMHFSRYAPKVTMAIRGAGLKETLSQYLVDRILSAPNVEVAAHTEVTALHGETSLDAITLTNNVTQKETTVDTRWLFLCLGGVPHTDWAIEAEVSRDSDGYILTGPDLLESGKYPKGWPLDRAPYYLETNRPGLFAAGDVRHGSVKRCASAVGEGAMAVTFVHRYLASS